ncbi:hypothetical protein [Spirosoma pollinicola]|uniref:Uncharacterized protein n=1 Tax=Spirosoma pollinicola TaxID=2057025 RepID=A0A2K8Z8A7_9BACT|nr:hypothetical protein [Spirosoma pollinicola]AUD06106.1 hypothetical protein CWM47_32235 [Spirosoma pollinicola]
MTQLQQDQQLALEKERVQREKLMKTAGEWQRHSTILQEAKTDLEQTIKTQQQTLARQQVDLAQLKAKNDVQTIENQKLQRESNAIKAELAALRQQALDVLEKLTALHDESPINYIPRQFWPLLDEFKASVEAKL